MKAVTYSRYGPPEVLQVESCPQPTPKDDEVLIRVHAAEATKADCELRSFRFQVQWFWLPLRLALGVFAPRRRILGGYFAGEVVAFGGNVSGFTAGQPVYGSAGLHMGSYGEYVALPASSTIVSKPVNLTFAEAAAVPLGGLNGLHFMRLAKIEPGHSVLIIGAGGSIGLHALQIARSMGARVTAVDSGIKAGLLRRFGADHVIDYTREDWTDSDTRYDVVFDMVPGSAYSACIRALKPQGRYLCGNPRLSVMLRSFLTRRLGQKHASCAMARETRDELESLTRMIESGDIAPIVDRVMSIEEAAEAHRLVESEQRIGAIVLAISAAAERTQPVAQ